MTLKPSRVWGKRRAAPKKKLTNRRHTKPGFVVEPLEERRLLALVVNPGTDSGDSSSLSVAQAEALASFHGDDLVGKDGPMVKAGFDLTLLFHEHQHGEPGSNPLIQTAGNRVVVNAVAGANRQALQSDLEALGMQVLAAEQSIIAGLLPIDKIDDMAGLGTLRFARPGYQPIHRAGLVDSEGDVAINGDLARNRFGVTGSGITVGVISDSYDLSGDGTAAADMQSNDLPTQGVDPLIESTLGAGADEGRAMLQVVHDVAPNARLSFGHADTAAQAAQNIRALAFGNVSSGSGVVVSGRPADIIVDDVGFLDQPFFQDGIIAQTVDRVVDAGVAYFSAAGNDGTRSYESPFRDSGIPAPSGTKPLPGGPSGPTIVTGTLHDFDDSSAVDAYQKFTLPVGSTMTISFQWDEPFGSLSAPGGPASTSDLDVLIVGADEQTVLAAQTGLNLDGDPVEVLTFLNDGTFDFDGIAGADDTFNLSFALFAGTAPGKIKYIEFDGVMELEEYDTASSTVFGHPNASRASAVASASWQNTPAFGPLGANPPLVNEYSSAGGTPILFDSAGNRLSAPVIRQTVDVTGPDGVSTTMATFTPFIGSSAAAAHVAGAAALMLNASGGPGSLSPAQVYNILETTATDIRQRVDPQFPSQLLPAGQGYDVYSGHGLVNALAAVSVAKGTPPQPPQPPQPPVTPGQIPGAIEGTKWHDRDGDGRQDSGEPVLSGWTIFADLNRDGRRSAGEPTAVTDSDGEYRLGNLSPGTYRIAEVIQPGWALTFPSSGSHSVTVSSGRTVTGIDFGNRQLGGTITGMMWNDLNGNQQHDADEPGVADLDVFVDLDGNGSPSLNEPSGVSDARGRFRIVGVPEGTQTVFEAYSPGWIRTTGNSRIVAVRNGETTVGTDFGHQPQFDFGDAPDSYPTLSSERGPVHGFVPGFYLGSRVDGEADGMPGPLAQGDDLDGSNDDDGVVFLSGLQAGETAEIAVVASQLRVSPGYLHAWLDFNADGDWDDPGEQIFQGRRLKDGANILTFQVPADAANATTAARFRWGFETQLSYDGPSFGGEVEDYLVTIPMAPDQGIIAMDDFFSVAEDASETPFNVLLNDLSRVTGDLTITSVGPTSQGGTVRIVDGSRLAYTPAANFFGEEEFTYEVRDDAEGVDTATVFVTVTPVNDNPTAAADEFEVGQSTSGNVLDVLANDSIAPDQGEQLTILNVSPSVAQANIDIISDGQRLSYDPPEGYLGSDTFSYTIGDGNGGRAQTTVTVNVVELPDEVAFRLEVVDESEESISSIPEGATFVLRGYVQDIREEPSGVFSAYLDVLYDNVNSVSVDGDITIGDTYPRAQSGDASEPGLLDEVGGIDGTSPLGGDETLLFSLPMRAVAPGTVTFAGDPADAVKLHEVSLFGESVAVRPSEITFGTATIEIVATGARDDEFPVLEDSENNVLDVLANDDLGGPGAAVIIVEVGDPDQGGEVIIAGESELQYTPAANFFGAEEFTYTIESGGVRDTATVTVNVANVNDPPTANDDSVEVAQGSQAVTLDVLDNDTYLPDPEEDLTITGTGTPNQGGTVEVAGDQKSLIYTPLATFSGTEEFTYQIRDGNGGTDEATVTAQVEPSQHLVRFHLQTTDTDGNPITVVSVDDTFLLKVSVEDLQDVPQGVFSAYLDVTYPSNQVSVAGDIAYNQAKYPSAQTGSTELPGIIDEAGAVDGITPLGGGAIELLSIPFTATGTGEVTFSGDAADDLPLHEVTVFPSTKVDPSVIDYGSAVITVSAANQFTNALEPADVNRDGAVTPMDALLVISDINIQGARRLTRSAGPNERPVTTYLDVNGDGYVSPMDALLVIDRLNQLSAQASSVPRAALSAGAGLGTSAPNVDSAADPDTGPILAAGSAIVSPMADGTASEPLATSSDSSPTALPSPFSRARPSVGGATTPAGPWTSGSLRGTTSVSSRATVGTVEDLLSDIAEGVAQARQDDLPEDYVLGRL